MTNRLMLGFVVILVVAACGVDTSEVAPTTSVGVTTQATTTTMAPSTTITTTSSTTTSSSSTTTTTVGPPPLTIMPVGDSITQGTRADEYTGTPADSTYRCFLGWMLSEAGVRFDFVGSQWQPYGGGVFGCPYDFDADHEGWWGYRLDQVAPIAEASTRRFEPDVVLIHLGSNDLEQGEEPDAVADELQAFVRLLQQTHPDITIVVAQVMPTWLAALNPKIEVFNELIAGFADLSTDTSSVLVVDMYTGLLPEHLKDPYHPNDAGAEILATRWYAALEAAGLV